MDDLLEHLRNVDGEKKDPGKGALKLMDKVFTDEEMSSHCFKKANGRGEKPALDQARVKRLKRKYMHACKQIGQYTILIEFVHTVSYIYPNTPGH